MSEADPASSRRPRPRAIAFVLIGVAVGVIVLGWALLSVFTPLAPGPTPTLTATATRTPLPPTATPTPTPTATPTVTPTTTPTPIRPEGLPDAVIIAVGQLGGVEDADTNQAMVDGVQAVANVTALDQRVQVVSVPLHSGITGPEDIDLNRDVPGAQLLLAWEQVSTNLLQVYLITPQSTPALVAVEDIPVAWLVTDLGQFPLNTRADDFTFLGQIASALVEINNGASSQAEQRLSDLQGAWLGSPTALADNNQAIWSFTVALARQYQSNRVGALEMLNAATRLAPAFTAAQVDRGGIYLSGGDGEAAATAFSTALQTEPDNPVTLYDNVLATVEQGDLDTALADADHLAVLSPTDMWRINLRGYVYFLRGEYDAALADFSLVSEALPSEPTPLFNEARTMQEMGDYGQALIAYDALIEMAPGYAPYSYYFGLTFLASGERDQALRALSEAVVKDANYTAAYVERGRLELEDGDATSALADAQRATRSGPDDPTGFALLGDAQMALGAFGEAETAYSEVIDLTPDDPAAYASRGWSRHQQENLFGAASDYQQALALGADDPEIEKRLGFAQAGLGRSADAITAFQAGISQGLDDGETYAGLAVAREMNGQLDQAETLYQQALDLEPSLGNANLLAEQPMWTSLIIDRAVQVLRRLGIDPYAGG